MTTINSAISPYQYCGLFLSVASDMMKLLILVCLLALHMEPCKSDLYMHFPPGSNNRLNGAGENVANNARLFDSQVGRPYLTLNLLGQA